MSAGFCILLLNERTVERAAPLRAGMEGSQTLGAVLRNPGASSGASTFFVLQDVGSKPAFVSHVGGVFPVFLLDHILQVVVYLRSNAHGLPEVFGPDGEDRSRTDKEI